MFPTVAETIVILFLCVCTFALGNLSAIGDAVWRLRCRLSPALQEGDDPSSSDPADD